MSLIKTTRYQISTEKESGAGEMSCYKSSSYSTSYPIVSEIVNDILSNVFEIILAKPLQLPKVEKITSNVVGDILDNILSPASNVSQSNDETVLLSDGIKRMIEEMKCPVEQKGVGDQIAKNKKEASITEPPKRNTLERKYRLTNLVRNSKQMLAKLVTNETDNEVRLTKSEEINEKLLKVIDLEGDDHYVEPGCSSSAGILQMPPEAVLHMIDLEANVHSEGKMEPDTSNKETSTYWDEQEAKKKSSENKKKCSLGAKILRYLKKNKDDKKNKN